MTEKEKVKTTIKNDKKIGRNDLCPCGSGKNTNNAVESSIK